jgi:hypothetical protein
MHKLAFCLKPHDELDGRFFAFIEMGRRPIAQSVPQSHVGMREIAKAG